ncbi:MAG: porin family protein [Gammaproteobacteria bacterium]|nr:porin family protein [Gammaproteobacteria bacterium]
MESPHSKPAPTHFQLSFLSSPGLATADGGLFIGASVGNTTVEDNFDGFVLDGDTNSYRLVTGFQFGDMLGLEIGYQDFVELNELLTVGTSTSAYLIKTSGWTAGASLDLPVGNAFSLFGRAGVYFWDADVIVDGFSIDLPGDENPYYGAGARVNVSPNLSLIGDWTRFELDKAYADTISIGFQYRFGR